MFDQMMLVHESVSANLATELRQFSAFHALVLKQRLLPLVRFPARLAEKSRFVTLLRIFLPLTRSRSLSIMRQLLPHWFWKIMQAYDNGTVNWNNLLVSRMISSVNLSICKKKGCTNNILSICRKVLVFFLNKCYSKDRWKTNRMGKIHIFWFISWNSNEDILDK